MVIENEVNKVVISILQRRIQEMQDRAIGIMVADNFKPCYKMSLVMRKRTGFPTRCDTNRDMQPQEMARALKFQIKEEEELYSSKQLKRR